MSTIDVRTPEGTTSGAVELPAVMQTNSCLYCGSASTSPEAGRAPFSLAGSLKETTCRMSDGSALPVTKSVRPGLSWRPRREASTGLRRSHSIRSVRRPAAALVNASSPATVVLPSSGTELVTATGLRRLLASRKSRLRWTIRNASQSSIETLSGLAGLGL